jgi:hypothetical protein
MKYLCTFYGGEVESEQGRAAGMAAMAKWYQGLGAALLDGGGPLTGGLRTVTPQGDANETSVVPPPHGYCILAAESMAAATAIAKGCPLLKAGRSISIWEVFTP